MSEAYIDRLKRVSYEAGQELEVKPLIQAALGHGIDESAWEPGECWVDAAVRGLSERDRYQDALERIVSNEEEGSWVCRTAREALNTM